MNKDKQEELRRFAHRSVLHWRRGDLNFIPGSTLQACVRDIKVEEAVQSVVDWTRKLARDITEAGFAFEDREFYVGGVDNGYLLTNLRLFVYSDKRNSHTIAMFFLKDIARVDSIVGWTAELTIETTDGRVAVYKKLGGVPDTDELYAIRDFDWQTVPVDESRGEQTPVSVGHSAPEARPQTSKAGEAGGEPWQVKAGVLLGGLVAFGFSYAVAPLILRNAALGTDVREAFFSFAGMCAMMTIGPAVLRVCDLKPGFILWVLVLSYARVYQSDRSVFLTPAGVAVFGALTYGAYTVCAHVAVKWLKKYDCDR